MFWWQVDEIVVTNIINIVLFFGDFNETTKNENNIKKKFFLMGGVAGSTLFTKFAIAKPNLAEKNKRN